MRAKRAAVWGHFAAPAPTRPAAPATLPRKRGRDEELPMNLSDLIERNAAFTPGKAALRFEGRTLSYGDLSARIAQAARALKSQLGVGRGDRVAILALNHPDYLVLLYACARLGALLLPLNWRLAVPEQVFILSDASAKVLIVEQDFAERPAVAQAGLAGYSRRRAGHGRRQRDDVRRPAGCRFGRRQQSAYRRELSAAAGLHLGHHRPPQGRGAAPGGVAVERRDEPPHARHDGGRSHPHRAAALPCRGLEHPDHAGAAYRRHRHHSCALCARRHAQRHRAGQADARRAGAGDHPGLSSRILLGLRPTSHRYARSPPARRKCRCR